LRKKVEEGYSLMVFPEGTRSENNVIKRFHKGAFFLAEQFNLDIIPIVIHGASEAIPKGDFIIYDSAITISILERIAPENDAYGKNYTERTKQLSAFFKAQHTRIRQELEGPEYFKKMLVNSYDYKEMEIIKSVKSNLNINLETYYHLNKYLSAKARILHLASDYGQLDLLLALQEPLRKIDSYNCDEEKLAVAKTNYIVRKRKISYFETLESTLKNQYDAVLISDEEYQNDLEEVIATTSCVILVNCSNLKSALLTFDFEIISEENQIIVLKKK